MDDNPSSFIETTGGSCARGRVLASAAVPSLFPAVEVDGDLYWDGLYSQNPPLRELLDTEPDELWIIQIDPATHSEVPRRPAAIRDRRNEPTANLSVKGDLLHHQDQPAHRGPGCRPTRACASTAMSRSATSR